MENIIELEVVEKYNPYHDSKGRFTSAGNATSFTFRSASGLAWDKKNVQRAIEREKQRTSGSKVDGCTSVKEVEDLFRENDWFAHGKRSGKRKDDRLTLEGCDLESAKEVYGAYEQFFNKYPQMVGKLDVVQTEKSRGKWYATSTMGYGSELVTLNTRYFGDSKSMKQDLESDMYSGFHPKDCNTIKSVVMHELGHSVDSYLSKEHGALGTEGRGNDFMSHELRPQVAKECGVKVADMAKEVSDYATKNAEEWFAESFSEYMCSPNPRKVATEVGRRVDGFMSGVK